MKLNQPFPNDILSSPEQGIQELMRGILVRTNFIPGVRHVIGWRGLKESFTSVEGWTAKIRSFPGVFGLYYDSIESVDDWMVGRFILSYFPDPQEDLVENFSLRAGAYTQRIDYLSHIRDFLLHPQFCELFNIGIIDLGVEKANHALILGLESISEQRSIAKDGVILPQEERMVELIKPGGYDQNFPSYNTALAFYQVLAASFSFNLEEPPVYMRYLRWPGKEIVYDATGCHWENPSDDSHEESLFLGYGKVDFKKIIDKTLNKTVSFIQDVSWENGRHVRSEYKDALWWKAHQIRDYKTLDKKILGIDDRPQLIVLTGFLGSGKTSFLQHFIEYQVQLNRFVAVIQNEIGEIGLDGKLLDHDYALTEIDEGCICCTLVGNLKNAIHQILSSFHPDCIVLETTGLANPYNLLDEISEVDDLVRFDSVTTMIDAMNIEKTLADYDVARDQITAADILLLNKTDLVTKGQRISIHQKLRDIHPTAPMISTAHGDVNPALIYGVDPQDTETGHKDQHSETAGHLGHSHESYGFSSHRISFTKPLDRELFINGIKSMPPAVFRIKGVVDLAGAGKPVLFQYVGGRFEFSEFNNPNVQDRFLIFIGQDLQKDLIDSFFDDRLRGKNG
ncbi:MAG: GTP-binding protein [Desulfobacterales bacterium]